MKVPRTLRAYENHNRAAASAAAAEESVWVSGASTGGRALPGLRAQVSETEPGRNLEQSKLPKATKLSAMTQPSGAPGPAKTAGELWDFAENFHAHIPLGPWLSASFQCLKLPRGSRRCLDLVK